MEPIEIINIQKQLLFRILQVYREMGLTTRNQINACNAMKILEEPLWKIPEVYGKLRPRYFSQGVYKVRNLMNREGFPQPPRSVWSPQNLDRIRPVLNEVSNEEFANNDNLFKLQLEHVVPRKMIIDLLLENIDYPERWESIIDSYNIGCLVFDWEHNLLDNNHFDPEDPWVRYRQANVRVWDRFKEEFLF